MESNYGYIDYLKPGRSAKAAYGGYASSGQVFTLSFIAKELSIGLPYSRLFWKIQELDPDPSGRG